MADARYRATVQYDGSGYAGWQVQPDGRTVQGELEGRLRRLGIVGRVTAAGRTDAGVHATGQEVAFDSPRQWDADDLARALNAIAPDDLWIESVRETAADFHPRFQATARRYEYFVSTGRDGRSPHRRRGTWWVDADPDLDALRTVALALPGDGDFETLSKAGQPELGTRCTIEESEWIVTPMGDLRFTIVADRFLHRMVRYLVATMIEVVTGRREPGELRKLLDSSPDARPPGPAPARGLYLTGVRYPEGWNRVPGVPGLWPLERTSG